MSDTISADLARLRRVMTRSGPKWWKRPLCWVRGHGYTFAFHVQGDPQAVAFCPYCGLDQDLPND